MGRFQPASDCFLPTSNQGGWSFSLFDGVTATLVGGFVAGGGGSPGVFRGWFEVVLPGWRPAHDPLVVMNLMVAAGA